MSRPHPIILGSIALGAAVALLTGCSPASPPAATPSPHRDRLEPAGKHVAGLRRC